jgi:cysteinyl-tRNA synthetase
VARLHPDRPPRSLTVGGASIPVVGPLRAYACGITPYDVTHLGHAATYLWTDAAVRVLAAEGTRVILARNVTDIDEALFAEAGRRGEHYDQLAAVQKFSFDRTMAALDIRTPNYEPSARQSVDRVVELAAALLAQDRAYVVDGTVFGRTSSAAAGLETAEAMRLAAEYGDLPDDDRKESPFDVAIWRRTASNDVSWPSPWGPGRPGWHAECAAMVLGTFGGGVDLHTGGADLAYPHHACETVLAEAATGVTPFARAWLRAGTVQINGAKMAKSTGNLVLVDDLLRDHSAGAVRLLCLHRQWAQSWDYAPAALSAAEELLTELYVAAGRPGGDADPVQVRLLDDLDVPGAVEIALRDGGAGARHLLDVLALG